MVRMMAAEFSRKAATGLGVAVLAMLAAPAVAVRFWSPAASVALRMPGVTSRGPGPRRWRRSRGGWAGTRRR